jgi:hypothetical protein
MPPRNLREHSRHPQFTPHCCPCCDRSETAGDEGLTRRGFLEGVGGLAALGGVALSGLSWSAISADEPGLPAAAPRRPLVVKPIFTYTTFEPRPQTSWRSWGAIQTQPQADEELSRIKSEINKLQAKADFPLEFLPVTLLHNGSMSGLDDLDTADMLLVYAAGGYQTQMDAIVELGKDTVFFVRHKSGPLYFLYEAIHPWTLRHNTDQLAAKGLDFQDIVVDELDEILWRLRSLCGLHNTIGSRILAVGGPGGWAQPSDVIAKLAKDRWKLDIQTVTYDDLGKLIQAARQDQAAVDLAHQRAEAYLKLPGTTLETKRSFVDSAFLLEQVFRGLMRKADCRAITINGCMGTIMPISETTACLPLSTLNDDGYLAFCESDFVVIPSGILLGNISGRPPFLQDPTYPHDGVITLAHCTGPRKMDGKTIEPARILTHFESDYGAAPKVEMHKGQKVTNIVPDFKAERWLGFSGEIIDAPFLPICRCQIDIRFDCDTNAVAERMPGFHWMLVYGDYLREAGYALKKIPVKWDCLG